MSIRSVDLMVLYSKLADVEKAAQGQQQAPRVSQEQIAAQEVRRKEVELTQVKHSPQDEGSGRIQEEPERKRGKQEKQRDSEEQAAPEEEPQVAAPAPKTPFRSGLIDIKA